MTFDLTKLDTSRAVSLAYMFYYCSSFFSLFLDSKDTSNVTNMKYMFYYCTTATSLSVRNWDVSNVEDFTECFRGCSSLATIAGLDTWCIGRRCKTMESMFNGCQKLQSVTFGRCNFWDLESMAYMFQRCYAIEYIDFSKCEWNCLLDTINSMFNGGLKLTTIYFPPYTTIEGAENGKTPSTTAACSKEEKARD